MITFQWNRSFVTNLPTVDDQHRHLVDLINALGSRLDNDEMDEEDLYSLVKELIDYADYHFSEEEALMRGAGVDPEHIDSHIDSHRRFIADIQLLEPSKEKHIREIGSVLLNYLVHWLTYHILGQDQSMARQIEAIRTGANARQALEAEQGEKDAAIEPLLAALNQLLAQLSSRNRELVELNRSLELRVVERTSALSQANEKLEALSLEDSLTGLSNRRHAVIQFALLWAECEELSAIMIDADDFKQVNDRHGHEAGDVVLKELAKTLQHSVRTDDLVFRLGGDEFLVLCPHTDLAGAGKVADHIRECVADLRVPTGDGAWEGSVSIGVAAKTAPMLGFHELMKAADESLYRAKSAGKNCVSSAAPGYPAREHVS